MHAICSLMVFGIISNEHHVMAVWMKGVWLWVDHIQAILQRVTSYGLWNCSGNPKTKFWQMKFGGWKINVLQDEGVDNSSHRMRTFVWDFEGSLSSQWSSAGDYIENLGNPMITFKIPHKYTHKFHFISRLVIKRGLELMASSLGSTFRKKEVGIRNLSVGIISFASPFNEGVTLENCIQALWEDRGGDFIQHEVFRALLEGKRSQRLRQHRNL